MPSARRHTTAKMASQRIEDYGLIGDMRTCALVGLDGSIDYMCWPTFDSPSIFCRLLDTTKGRGGHWSIHPNVTTVRKQNYVSASNILQTRWIHEEGLVVLTDFFAIRKESKEAFKKARGPVLLRKLECMRGTMTIDVEIHPQPNYATGKTSIGGILNGDDYTQRITWITEEDMPDGGPPPIVSVAFLPADGQVDESTAKLFSPIGGNAHGSDGVRAQFVMHEGQQIIMQMSSEADPDLSELAEVTLRREREVNTFWRNWIRKCTYRGRMLQEVERSLLVLKLLTYKPTGAIVAAPTFSLPEHIGGTRNWDYRYSWVRDSSFTVYVFLKMGFAEEAEAYMNFIFARILEWQAGCTAQGKTRHLPLMFSIDGETMLPEEELEQFGGYLDSKPVRIGNAATGHVQLDIYGELMDAIYLFNKHGKPITYDQWVSIRHLTDFVCSVWNQPDMSIWEVRGKKENFVYSKMMLWVAVDRALRLADKRNLPCPKRLLWMEVRDTIYEEVMEKGFNKELGSFIQSYESDTTLDAAVLIAPLVFFTSPNDPRFLGTLEQILKSPHKGGLTSAGLVYRYNHEKKDDGESHSTSATISSGNLLTLTLLPPGVGGREGTFVMCTLWLIEALVRAGKYNVKYLDTALNMFETVVSFSNDLGLFSEEIAISGEQLGNTPQAFSHLAFISAAFNLERVLHGDKHVGF